MCVIIIICGLSKIVFVATVHGSILGLVRSVDTCRAMLTSRHIKEDIVLSYLHVQEDLTSQVAGECLVK